MTNRLENDLLERVVGLVKARGLEAYLVGGTVRDWLMGRPVKDLDFAVHGDALALARHVADELGAAYVPLDPERNTARVVIREPQETGSWVPSRHIDMAGIRGADIEADLWGRDFTVNAIAVDINHLTEEPLPILDPTGGQQDLERRRVRAVSETVFEDDPVRLLRAVRLAAQIEGYIEPRTQGLMRKSAALLSMTSPERIRDEFVKILLLPDASTRVRLLDAFGVLKQFLPEVAALHGLSQPLPHVYDAYEHSLATLAELDLVLRSLLGGAPSPAVVLGPVATYASELRQHLVPPLVGERTRAVLLKLVALLHDIGKPATRSVEPTGRVRFLRHEFVGAMMAAEVMRRLRFAGREVRLVEGVVRHHMRPLLLGDARQVTRRTVYRFFRDAGPAGRAALVFSLADYRGTRGAAVRADAWARRLNVVRVFLERYFTQHAQVVAPPKLIDGNDLMRAFSLQAGRQIGLLLEAVREAQAAGLVATRDGALTLAEGLLQDPKALEALAAGLETEDEILTG